MRLEVSPLPNSSPTVGFSTDLFFERYFLFRHLTETGEFRVFDDWCFKSLYEANNRVKSSAELQQKEQVKQRRVSASDRRRYDAVRIDPAVRAWRRPDMETTAKRYKLKFLYDAGYDYASSFVHPISTDGVADFFRLTKRPGDAPDDGGNVLVHNSILIVILHLQQFMNAPDLKWVKLLYDLLDRFTEMLADPNLRCDDLLRRVGELERSGHVLVTARPWWPRSAGLIT